MDKRYKYVNEYVVNEIVKIICIKFTEYDSDILSKNLSEELYEKNHGR